MNQKELKKAIKEKTLENFYIFCSDDYFLKKLYLDRIKESDDFGIEIIDIEDDEQMDRVFESLSAQRLFLASSKRLVYARVHYVLNKVAQKNKSKNILILDPAGCKNLKHKNVIMFKNPDSKEMEGFINYRLRGTKKSINKDAVDLILHQFKDKNASALDIFMDKVLLFANEDSVIKKSHIETLIDAIPLANVFKIVEFILKNDKDNFFCNIDTLLDSTHPSVLISILTNEIIKILSAKYIKLERLASLQINTNFFSKYRTYLQNIKEEKIVNLLNILYELDFVVKSQTIDGFVELFKVKMFEWFIS